MVMLICSVLNKIFLFFLFLFFLLSLSTFKSQNADESYRELLVMFKSAGACLKLGVPRLRNLPQMRVQKYWGFESLKIDR